MALGPLVGLDERVERRRREEFAHRLAVDRPHFVEREDDLQLRLIN